MTASIALVSHRARTFVRSLPLQRVVDEYSRDPVPGKPRDVSAYVDGNDVSSCALFGVQNVAVLILAASQCGPTVLQAVCIGNGQWISRHRICVVDDRLFPYIYAPSWTQMLHLLLSK